MRGCWSTTNTPAGLAGDGIVTLAFGWRDWAMTKVLIDMVRESGCQLPIMVFHNGDHAADGRCIAKYLDAGPGVVFRDIKGHRGGAWQAKVYAVMHSGFRRVLWLDADAYPVIDPTPLFAALDAAPFVYWQDLPNSAHNVRWEATGFDGRGVPQVQGGHFLVNVQEAWRFLAVNDWLNRHSDYWYRCGYGDQDCHRIALAAGTARFHVVAPCRWRSFAFVCDWRGAARPGCRPSCIAWTSFGPTACPAGTAGCPARSACRNCSARSPAKAIGRPPFYPAGRATLPVRAIGERTNCGEGGKRR